MSADFDLCTEEENMLSRCARLNRLSKRDNVGDVF